jgi:TetR/AcrR family transcriptional regulator
MTEDGTPTRGRRLSAEERRTEILRSSKEVFLRSGLAGARIRDLAAHAGINDATLYHYFASKEELFDAAVAEPLRAAVAATTAKAIPPFDAGGDVMREHTEAFIYDLLAAMEEVGPLLGVVLFGEQQTGQKYWRELIEPMLDQVHAIARRNMPIWHHRDYDPELAVDTIFGATFFLAIQDRFSGGKPPDLRLTARRLCTLLFEGMAASKAP